MSISITVSGDGSSQVIQPSSQGESITVSSTDGRQITVTPSDSPTTIVSETPGVASDLTTAFAPALASQSNDLTNFQLKLKAVTGVLNARLDDISGATGILNTQVTGNTADITGIEFTHGSFSTRISGISGQVNTVSGLTLAANAAISTNIDNTSNIVLLSDATGILNTQVTGLTGTTGSFVVTGSDVTFGNLTVSGNILPENTGASIGTPSGRFKDLHLSENSIFLGDSKISFSGGASGGLVITGSGLTGSGGAPRNITLLGQDDDGRIAVQNSIFGNSIVVGRKIFVGDGAATGQIDIKGPGPMSYSLTTHSDGFKITDNDSAGDFFNIRSPFTPDDTIELKKPTSVLGGLFTSSGIQRSSNGDTDTAYLFPENDTLSLRTSGVERLSINKSGKLGIGTGKQASRLVHIKTNTTDDDGQHPLRVEGASSSIIELKAGDNTSFVGIDFSDNAAPHPGSIIYNHTNNSMAFDTNDATRMTISDSGHVIITGDLTVASGITIGTGTVLTSGETQTNIDTAVANLVDSAPGTLNTLNELAAALGDDANFSTTTATSLGNLSTATGNLSTATGNLNTRVNSNDSDISALNTATGALSTATGLLSTATGVLQGVTGSFAQTGLGVNFSGVGIGTTTITAGKKLDVAGDVKAVGIEASEINIKDADGYFIENKQFAKFESNTLKFGDHDGENFTTDIFGNGGVPMIRITGDGAQAANTFVGIGTIAPQAKLHVAGTTSLSGNVSVTGNITSNGIIKAINNSQNVAQLEVGRDHNQYLEMKVSDPDVFITANQDSDSNGDHHFVLDRVFAGAGANDFEIRKGGAAQVTVNTNGNVGIGTTTPSAPLHVSGNTIVSGDLNVALGNEDHLDIDVSNYIYKLGDISGGDNGSFLEINSPNGVASVSNAAFGIGVALPQASLHVNGTATVSGGLTTLGKTTLSSDAFVTETGSFTLGATHKGATVLLQNSTGINITVPAQVSGYITTFIAETHNSVSFITGAGMSGLNSFQGASDMAGIYGQAQVIYKSAEYAFLGGNVV